MTPLSGPLARYGVDAAEALALWADEAARLPPQAPRVRLTRFDAHPRSARGMRAALATHPDLVFGPYGTGPAIAALEAAENRLVWNHGGSASAISWRRFRNVVNVPTPATRYLRGVLEAVREADPNVGSAVLLHAATTFGRDVASGASDTAAELGLTLTSRACPRGNAAAVAAELPAADVLLVAAGPEDELAAADILLRRRWRAAAFVSAGVAEVLASIGDRLDGVLGPAQWMPEVAPIPDEGPPADWFVDRYRSRTGRVPSYPAAQAFAAGLLAARCVREAGVPPRDDALLACAKRLDCTTLYGRFGLDPETGHQRLHVLITVQWQNGRRIPVWPPDLARQPVTLH